MFRLTIRFLRFLVPGIAKGKILLMIVFFLTKGPGLKFSGILDRLLRPVLYSAPWMTPFKISPRSERELSRCSWADSYARSGPPLASFIGSTLSEARR